MFFEGFGPPRLVTTADGDTFRLRSAGSGPAVLLLHGHPQTHAIWHEVGPHLVAAGHAVVCPDLPGYGGSCAGTRLDPLAGTKAAMARRLLALLDALGLGGVAVAGHDRGARVAERLALDAPERVRCLALLDVVPSLEPVERSDMAYSLAAYRAFWFAQTHPKPESLIRTPPSMWLGGTLPGSEAPDAHFHPEAIADYVSAGVDPDTIGRMGEAYRHATALDAVSDRIAHASGERITCPTLVLWGERGVLGGWYDPVALWRSHVAGPLEGGAIDAGHFPVEENPDLVAARLASFFGAGDAPLSRPSA